MGDGWIPFEVGFYGWIVCIGGDIWRNKWLIVNKKKDPSYWGNFLYRAWFGASCLFIMRQDLDPLGDLGSIWRAAPVMLYQVMAFYILFDPILNLWRKLPWDYRGKSSGWLDTFFNKRDVKWYYAFKMACLILLVLSIIIIK